MVKLGSNPIINGYKGAVMVRSLERNNFPSYKDSTMHIAPNIHATQIVSTSIRTQNYQFYQWC